jgi:hypothetical protein
MPFGLPPSWWPLFVAAFLVTVAVLLYLSARRTSALASPLAQADDQVTQQIAQLDQALRGEHKQRAAEREQRLHDWMGILREAAAKGEQRRQADYMQLAQNQFNMLRQQTQAFLEGTQGVWQQMADDLVGLRQETQQLRLTMTDVRVGRPPPQPGAQDSELAKWIADTFGPWEELPPEQVMAEVSMEAPHRTALARRLLDAVQSDFYEELRLDFDYGDLLDRLWRPRKPHLTDGVSRAMAQAGIYLWTRPNGDPRPLSFRPRSPGRARFLPGVRARRNLGTEQSLADEMAGPLGGV